MMSDPGRAAQPGAMVPPESPGGKDASMIKSLSLLTRKDGMTHEQFVAHWVKVHAPLATSCPG